MESGLIYVKLKNLDDLIRLIASSPTPFLQHTVIEDKHVYFIQSVFLLGRPLIYYFESKGEIQKKYIVYNRFKDEISYSDKLGSDGQSVYISVIEIEKTNLFNHI